MGRSGIRRRKPKRRLPRADHPASGILADFDDQARWSSYGQHIPRFGDRHREEIWWQRGFRVFRNLRNIRHNTSFRSRDWWTAVLSTMLIFAVFIGAILGLAALLANRLP